MSPPAGDIYCFSLRVCASVRPSVRPFVCNAFLSEPDLQEPFEQKICKKFLYIHPRITGVFCSVSEDIPIVQRWSHFFKMLDFGSVLAIFAISVSKIVLFLILSPMQNSIHLITNVRPGFANNYSTVGYKI